MNKRLLLKALLVAVYVYALAWIYEFFVDDSLSSAFKITMSISLAFFAYIQMYNKNKNNS
ncbi:hypothetical protein [Guptibacillus hwajinpoensis]|uniref:hypothetical protein n=1 Tax=Guptibacillus hwajinpoensis TaxID=208199 RepID=UPI0024B336C0|nr:hypothetical protein [Pseudalkalibacillus hwajinpoensis]